MLAIKYVDIVNLSSLELRFNRVKKKQPSKSNTGSVFSSDPINVLNPEIPASHGSSRVALLSKKCFEVTFPGRQTELITERHLLDVVCFVFLTLALAEKMKQGLCEFCLFCFCLCFSALVHIIEILHRL